MLMKLSKQQILIRKQNPFFVPDYFSNKYIVYTLKNNNHNSQSSILS